MPRNVVLPRSLSRDNSSRDIGAGPITHSLSPQHPQIQQLARSPPRLQRSKSHPFRLHYPRPHSQQTECPPLTHRRLHSINTELDRQSLYQQSTFSNEHRGVPYSADAQHWYRPLIGDTGDGDMQPTNAPDSRIYPMPMVSFEMHGGVPSDAMRTEHPGGAYAHSPDVDNPNYYASIHAQASTSVAMDSVRRYPTTLLQNPRYPHSQVQQQRNVLEYELWSGPPTGSG